MADQILRLSDVFPHIRPAEDVDEPLLVETFAGSHCAGFELLGMEPAALTALVGMQYRARQAQYRSSYPEAVEYLILSPDGDPVGSCWLDDRPDRLRVLDIAVLPAHRRRGLARAVLCELVDLAAEAGKPVGLSVWHENVPALELYRGLGFTPSAAGPARDGDLGNGYLELELLPERAPRPRAGMR